MFWRRQKMITSRSFTTRSVMLVLFLIGIISLSGCQTMDNAGKNDTENRMDGEGDPAAPQEAESTESVKWTPIQISFWPKQWWTALFGEDYDVYGLRLNPVKGRNQTVAGLDVGVINSAKEAFGVQIGVLGNGVRGKATGLQIGGFFNIVDGNATGLQIGGLFNGGKGLTGVQIGILGNLAKEDATGVQIGVLGNAVQNLKGVQIGCLGNGADGISTGVQIGLFNTAGNIRGVQLGLINYNKYGWLPIFPIINFNF